MNKVCAAVLSLTVSTGMFMSGSAGVFCSAVIADQEYDSFACQGYTFQMPAGWTMSEKEDETTFSINTEEAHAMIRFKTSPYPGDSFQEQYAEFDAAINGIGEGDDAFARQEIKKYPVGDNLYLIGEFTKSDRNYITAFLADKASGSVITVMLADNTLGGSFANEFYRVLDSTEAGEDKIPTQQVWDSAKAPSAASTEEKTDNAEETEAFSSDEQWEALEALGNVEVTNGILTVSLTLPAEFAEGATQEELDSNAGETYQSAVLNEDGSVTFKMTKEQHRKMLSSVRESIDESLQTLIDDDEHYNIAAIDYNRSITEFNIQLDGNTVTMVDGFAALGLYVFGGMYSIFTGENVDNITVNYYAADGTLLETANSSEMQR